MPIIMIFKALVKKANDFKYDQQSENSENDWKAASLKGYMDDASERSSKREKVEPWSCRDLDYFIWYKEDDC